LAGGGVLAILAATGVYLALRTAPTTEHPDARLAPGEGAAPSERADALSMQSAANALSGTDSLPGTNPLTVSDKVKAVNDHAGGSMDAAVAGLERRLAAGSGSDADWDLLAKSYDFLGRKADAAEARQRRLPAGAAGSGAAGGAPPASDMGNPASIEMAPSPRRAQVSAAAGKLLDEADAARRRHDFAAAREVYAKLVARQEMTAGAWADYADVVGTLNGNSLGGEPERYVQNALRIDPQNAKALWLLASLQHARKQYTAAVATWGKLGAVLAPNSDDANLVAANLAQDQALARGMPEPPGPAMAATTSAPQSVNDGVAVSGEVVLADSLRSRVPAGLTLFIVAKSVNSPGPPVAILRATTDAWPVRFRLDDSQSMMPQRKLSTAGPVTIEARTSKSGQAMPAPGDFQGVTTALDPAAGKPVRIVIERVIG
jgi:cytochrome c-type biogenesis protein CcmH